MRYDAVMAWTRFLPWWRHQMETFSALLAICAGNSPVPGEFPTQRPVTRSFDVYFDLRPNKRLSKQSLGWWFEPLSPPLWRHRNALLAVCEGTASRRRISPSKRPIVRSFEVFFIVCLNYMRFCYTAQRFNRSQQCFKVGPNRFTILNAMTNF